jgi:DNA repair exonuclease SbcCD nuclease subunit
MARLFGGDGTGGLRCVLDTARALRGDVVLLAGDIFDHNRLPLDLVRQTARVLGESGLQVVILPGNHDPLTPESVYLRGPLAEPDNVHVLGVTHELAVHLGDFDLEVWGHAHRDYNDMAPLRAPRARSSRWQVAMAHGHYDPAPDFTTPYRPAWLFSDDEIAATGADYVALGHWNRAVRVGNGAVPAYYSGSPDYARTVNVVRLRGNGTVDVDRAPIGGLPPME